MARTLRRRPLLSRLLTTFLTLIVVVMFTGVLGAAPVSFAEEGQQESVVDTATPDPVVAQSTDAPPDGSSDAAPPEGETEGVTPAEEPPASPPVSSSFSVSAAEISPLLAEPGTGIKINFFEGYNRWAGWTTGNLGKNYEEGEWVAYRLILENTGSDEASPLDLIFGLDHFNDGKNAVMFEQTDGWGYRIYDTMPGSTDPDTPPVGLMPLTPVPHDAGIQGVSPVIEWRGPITPTISPAVTRST